MKPQVTMRILLLVGTALTVACAPTPPGSATPGYGTPLPGWSRPSSPSQQQISGTSVQFTPILETTRPAADGRVGRRIIDDSLAWAATWIQLHQGIDPVPTIPAIDFRHEMVAGIVEPGIPSRGRLAIDSILTTGTQLILIVRVERGPCFGTDGYYGGPVLLVRLPRMRRAARFLERPDLESCRF